MINRVEVEFLNVHICESGWDIFSLNYKFDNALKTFFNKLFMENYKKFFNFMLKIKRLLYLLNKMAKEHFKSEKQFNELS